MKVTPETCHVHYIWYLGFYWGKGTIIIQNKYAIPTKVKHNDIPHDDHKIYMCKHVVLKGKTFLSHSWHKLQEKKDPQAYLLEKKNVSKWEKNESYGQDQFTLICNIKFNAQCMFLE